MFSLFLHDMWKILLYSLLLGAGLPVLYAVGVRASAVGSVAADGAEPATSTAAVRAGIGVGLAYIVASGHGEQLSFQQGYPTFVPKS